MTTLSKLKDILDKLTPDQLEQPAYFVDQENSNYGVVMSLKKADKGLCCWAEDQYFIPFDEAVVALEDLMEGDVDDIEEVIPKGAYYLSL